MIIAQKKILIYSSGFVQDVYPIFVVIGVTFTKKLYKLPNERTNYWFCPTCAKPALNAVFLDKDIDKRRNIFLDSMEAGIADVKSEQFSTNNSINILEDTLEQNNSAVTHCMETLNSLNERVNTLEKVANESFNIESSPTIEINNKENYNTNQKQEKSILMN